MGSTYYPRSGGGGGPNNPFNISLASLNLIPSAGVMTSTGFSVGITATGNYTMGAAITPIAQTGADAVQLAVSKDGINFIYLGGAQLVYPAQQSVISGSSFSIPCTSGDTWTLYVGSVAGVTEFFGTDDQFTYTALYFSGFQQA